MRKTEVKKKDYTKADMRVVSDNPEWTKEDFAKASLLGRRRDRRYPRATAHG